jgi:hypothetical protein
MRKVITITTDDEVNAYETKELIVPFLESHFKDIRWAITGNNTTLYSFIKPREEPEAVLKFLFESIDKVLNGGEDNGRNKSNGTEGENQDSEEH